MFEIAQRIGIAEKNKKIQLRSYKIRKEIYPVIIVDKEYSLLHPTTGYCSLLLQF